MLWGFHLFFSPFFVFFSLMISLWCFFRILLFPSCMRNCFFRQTFFFLSDHDFAIRCIRFVFIHSRTHILIKLEFVHLSPEALFHPFHFLSVFLHMMIMIRLPASL
ncbi:hypothetical protein DFH27DRAFT_548773 [Peziza echinospora]|nr:hypothetical protein DFH27DRAFT_548773 [Peziza echinospora]